MEHVYSVLVPNLIESSNFKSSNGLYEWFVKLKTEMRINFIFYA